MKRNRVSGAMLAALAVCGAVQGASFAQGGVLLPEATTTAPMVRSVPHVVENSAKALHKEAQNDAQMPRPAKRPIAASGRIVHVQVAPKQGNSAAQRQAPVVAPVSITPAGAPMSMSGYVQIVPPVVGMGSGSGAVSAVGR